MRSRNIVRVVLVGALAVGAAACRDRDAHTKLDAIDQRIAGLEKSLDRLDTIALRLGALTRQVDRLDELSVKIDRMDQAARRRGGLAGVGAAGRLGGLGGRGRATRPDPNEVYAVPIAGAPFRGRRNAAVTIVRSFEFACPYCRRTVATMDALLKEYPRDLKIVYKHFIVHRNAAEIPARAACAAHRQGKFAPMEKLIWERGFDAGRDLSVENMRRLARSVGLKMSRFLSDMNGSCRQVVQRDQGELSRVGARGTPAFFINGRYLSGARPIAQFRRLIDEELRKAKDRIALGTAAAKYYRTWVMDRGKSSL